jgi:hypothetical protein
MNHYYIYKTATGEITQSGYNSEEALEEVCAPDETLGWGEASRLTHYVLNGELVPFTPEEALRRQELHPLGQWDPSTRTWSYVFDVQKKLKWMAIKNQRDLLEESGFEYLGKVFDSGPRDVQRISVAAQAASAALAAGAPFSITWKCQDNSYIDLNAQQMLGVPVALAIYAAGLHARAAQLLVEIEVAQSAEDLAAVVW